MIGFTAVPSNVLGEEDHSSVRSVCGRYLSAPTLTNSAAVLGLYQ